jgi:hypothetical protein
LDTFSSPNLLQQCCQKWGNQNGLGNFGKIPRSQTPFGNAAWETPFRARRETEFPGLRSQTEFGNEG